MEDVLMMKIAGGDEDSFKALYGMWARRVMAYAYRALRDADEAQDVVQETFVQLYKAAPKYRSEGKFPSFIFRIAGNQVRMRFRRARPTESLSEMDDEGYTLPPALSYSPEDGLINAIDIDRLLAMIPPRQRDALLFVANGASYVEAAEKMGATAEAVAQLVLRGRRALRARMKEANDDIR